MSYFPFKDLKTKEDKIGVWIRPSSISNKNLVDKLRKTGRVQFNEIIDRIIIKDVRHGCDHTCKHTDAVHGEQVLLEVWLYKMTFRRLFNVIFNRPYEVNRYIVFTCWEVTSPDWICEGDLGKGYTE